MDRPRPARVFRAILPALLAAALTIYCRSGAIAKQTTNQYSDLTTLFTEWRAFQQPKVVDGVPDYTRPAMVAQRELAVEQE